MGEDLLEENWRRIYKLFVSTSQISPIGGTIIEVKFALQLQEVVVCNEKHCICG